MSAHLSSFEIDLLDLETLSDEARRRVDAHRADCTRCQATIDEARALKGRFAREVLPRTIDAVAARRRIARSETARRRGWRWRWMAGAVGAAALATVALMLVIPRQHLPEDIASVDDGPAVSLKGGPSLRVFARRGGQVFAVHDGAHLRGGDEVRFVAQSAGFPYLLIVSVDGASKVSVYYPYDGAESARMTSEKATELPDSLRLDGTLGPERVFALFSRAPLSAADVRASLAAVARRGPAGIRSQVTPPIRADAALTLLFEKDPL
ncbi:MAG: hypothetical protein QOI66_5032 [Myxococcales bacterium]|jgi:hypothetical protein|nr:hypothetical protein [Myxococcales bacterium]